MDFLPAPSGNISHVVSESSVALARGWLILPGRPLTSTSFVDLCAENLDWLRGETRICCWTLTGTPGLGEAMVTPGGSWVRTTRCAGL
jgi:hypothetical protein